MRRREKCPYRRSATRSSASCTSFWKYSRISANNVIAEVVPETGWSPNTVRTLLIRFVDKGVLHVQKKRRREKEYFNCVYTPLFSREECEAAHGRLFLERVFAGDTLRLLAHFVKDGDLTPEQVEELRKQLNKK